MASVEAFGERARDPERRRAPDPDAQLTPDDREDLLVALAAVARNESASLRLLRALGFPVGATPAWTGGQSPEDWWAEVMTQLDAGRIPQPYRRLIIRLADTYSANEVFLRLFNSYVGKASSPDRSGRPEPARPRLDAPVEPVEPLEWPDGAPTYDIAVSFAGAQRGLVEPVVRACEARGVRVFYDKDSTVEFWGRNFVYGMRVIYGGARARYFVPFLSKEYLASAYPMDEFNTAMTRAIEVGVDTYILPILVGSVEVPAELLSPSIGFLRLDDYAVDQLAQIVADRVEVAHQQHQEPRRISGVIGEAFQVRLPRRPPVRFSTYETLAGVLARVGRHFQRAAGELAPFGVRCSVRVADSAVTVRVERQGNPVCGLQLRFDNTCQDDRLVMAFAWPQISGDAANGWVTAEWDAGSGGPRLSFFDLGRQSGTTVTTDQLFHLFWGKIIEHLESAR